MEMEASRKLIYLNILTWGAVLVLLLKFGV